MSKIITELGTRLSESQAELDRLERYWLGTQPTAFVRSEVKAQAPGLFDVIAAWPRLIVGAVDERLDVQGFRIEDDIDDRLWSIWQSNSMDEGSQLVHEAALVYGRAHASVWADAEGRPTIRPESPRQMITDTDPSTGRVRVALKMWTDQRRGWATLYFPDRIERWVTKSVVPEGPAPLSASAWKLREEPLDNPLGAVPVVTFANRRALATPNGRGEFADVLGLCDAINKLLSDMLTSAEFSAMPRRWATGIELPLDDAGEPIAAFSVIAGRVWMSEEPDTKMGQFPEADLGGYLGAIELLTQQISSLTGTPPHMLNILKGQLTSAESIRAAETGLVTKARRRQTTFGESWETVMRLAAAADGGRSDLDALETVWRDPETQSDAQAADAAMKLATIGVPFAQLAERLGFTPQQIETMRGQRRADVLDQTGFDLGGLAS